MLYFNKTDISEGSDVNKTVYNAYKLFTCGTRIIQIY